MSGGSQKKAKPATQSPPDRGRTAAQSASGTPHVPLKVLVDAFDKILATTKRLEKEGASR